MRARRNSHPLGKCIEERLDLTMPAELKERLAVIARLHAKTPTAWARDTLEKAIEGEWTFIRRRVASDLPGDNRDRSGEDTG